MADQVLEVEAHFPPKFQRLFEPSRYKILYGGRAGGKSWAIARMLLLRAVQEPIRVLCCRETMTSLKDSVHKLLSDQIEAMGLSALFDIQQGVIKVVAGPGVGSEFNFEGIRLNAAKIRSYEGISVAWVEEAAQVSKGSWDVLIPTIRAERSEIILSFNPNLITDETWKRFIVNTPPNAILLKIDWTDNPYLSADMISEIEHLKATNFKEYMHIYGGEPKTVLEGAVYEQELLDYAKNIMNVPYDSLVGVSAVFDLGFSDATAIWFVQKVAFETRFIDYLENNRKPIEWYLQEIQKKGYTIDTVWLPHDARAKSLGTGRSIEEIVRAKGYKVRIVPKLSLVDGINAGRMVFPNCYFDQERCADGVHALRNYTYELIEDPVKKIFTKTPKHDWTSHGADAFRYAAIAVRQPSNTISRVSHALLVAQEAEEGMLKRLGRYAFGAGASSTNWMG